MLLRSNVRSSAGRRVQPARSVGAAVASYAAQALYMLVFMIAKARALTGGGGAGRVRIAARASSFQCSTTSSVALEPNESSGWNGPGPMGMAGWGFGGFWAAWAGASQTAPTRATTRDRNAAVSAERRPYRGVATIRLF